MTIPKASNQVLVRFQNKSYVYEGGDNCFILHTISERTGWPLQFLHITTWSPPFCSVAVRSSVLGGKGGFGTLLKGASRQAGAKATTNFSACRDLQGRRLRHVNDSIDRQVLEEWTQKVAAGTATKEEMVRALVKTASGLPGWHLQVPAWAAITKKERRKVQRQYQNWKREQNDLATQKEEQRKWQEYQVRKYTESADTTTIKLQEGVQAAIHQGLAAQKEAKRRKLEPDPPECLLTLTGDMTLEFVQNRWQIQSLSNFGTSAVMLRDDIIAQDCTLYWEVKLITGGLVQVGWARSLFRPSSESGDGVGDDSYSWAYDGSRSIRLHNETSDLYGVEWQADDVIGCSCNRSTGELSFSINGQDLGVAYPLPQGDDKSFVSVFPAISLNSKEIVEVRLNADELEYTPDNAVPVGRYLDSRDDVEAAAEREVVVDRKVNLSEEDKTKEATVPTTEEHLKLNEPDLVQPIDLDQYASAEDLEHLGMNRIKGALMAVGAKCGGTLKERARRLFSLKGLRTDEYPKKTLAKRSPN